jgi:hypothetical protein
MLSMTIWGAGETGSLRKPPDQHLIRRLIRGGDILGFIELGALGYVPR